MEVHAIVAETPVEAAPAMEHNTSNRRQIAPRLTSLVLTGIAAARLKYPQKCSEASGLFISPGCTHNGG
jgi:hypothetical protein